ncbi:MAG: hypothetical protein LBC70_08255 [Chitinispirillales bacterium]|nr:hypothetical protein [Chitinispirillales bacterium]
MKRCFWGMYIITMLLWFAMIGCGDGTGLGVCTNPKINSDSLCPLIGTNWKLVEVSIAKNYQPHEIIDYSKKNITFEFQANGKLIVSGETDGLFVFDDFNEGEHFYEYREMVVCPTCLPGHNLEINRPFPLKEGGRYFVFFDGETMSIGGYRVIGGVIVEPEFGVQAGGDYYSWKKNFIKIK